MTTHSLDYIVYIVTRMIGSGEFAGFRASEIARAAHEIISEANAADLEDPTPEAETKMTINLVVKGMVDAITQEKPLS